MALARHLSRVGSRQHVVENGGHGQHDGIDLRRLFPAEGQHQEGRPEVGDGSPDIADAEESQGRSLMLLVEPLGGIGDADDEGSAGKTHTECGNEENLVGPHLRQEPAGHGGGQHLQGEDQPASELFCPYAEEDPADRSGQDRRSDQDAELRLRETEVLLDLDADDGKDRPDGKADGKGECAQAQGFQLIASRDILEI